MSEISISRATGSPGRRIAPTITATIRQRSSTAVAKPASASVTPTTGKKCRRAVAKTARNAARPIRSQTSKAIRPTSVGPSSPISMRRRARRLSAWATPRSTPSPARVASATQPIPARVPSADPLWSNERHSRLSASGISDRAAKSSAASASIWPTAFSSQPDICGGVDASAAATARTPPRLKISVATMAITHPNRSRMTRPPPKNPRSLPHVGRGGTYWHFRERPSFRGAATAANPE